MTTAIKVFVAIPNMGYTDPAAYDNRLLWACKMGVEQERAKHENVHPTYEFFFCTAGKLLTPFARDVLAQRSVDCNMDLVFMVDDDMLGAPDTFFTLAQHVVDGPADICGALAFTRNPPHDPVLYTCLSGYDTIDRRDYFINRPIQRYPRNTLVECDAVGFGAVVFTVDLLRNTQPPWFMFPSSGGEDILFCYRMKKEVKARVFCDTTVKLGHVGNPQIVTEDTYDSWNEMQAKRERDGDEHQTVGFTGSHPWASYQ